MKILVIFTSIEVYLKIMSINVIYITLTETHKLVPGVAAQEINAC